MIGRFTEILKLQHLISKLVVQYYGRKLPGRKRSKEGKESIEPEQQPRISDGATSTSTSKKKSKSRKEVDIDSWLDKNLDELVLNLGLDSLGLSREEYIELLRQPLELLYGSPSSRPDVETIVKRFRRYGENVFPLIAQSLLLIKDSLSPEQLDFVVNNIGKLIINAAPRIYKEAIKLGKDEILQPLRGLWRSSWLELRSKNLPMECPVCHFNSLIRDMVCIVCGSIIDERMLKKFINFNSLLIDFLRSQSCSELARLLRYDYVLVNNNGIKHPESVKDEVTDIEIVLDKSEKELIREVYSEMCEG